MKTKKAFYFIFFIIFSSISFANPFYGGNSTLDKSADLTKENTNSFVAPVRSSPPSEQLVSGQLGMRTKLAERLSEIKTNASPTIVWSLLLVSFLYGVLHAIGPGHRKTIVFSYYLARKAPVWEPASLAFVLSFLHAGTAIVLILLLRGLTGSLAGRADNIGLYLEGFSYIFLAIVSLLLVLHSIKDVFFKSKKAIRHSLSMAMIIISGIYPCPGAILILALSNALQLTGFGILSVLAMSIGMTIPILVSGYLAWFGRTGVFLAIKNNEKIIGKLSSIVELLGYLFLLAFSIWIAYPFIISFLTK